MFGSCWGLQVITAAAGGSVRKNPKGREIGFGRGIRLTEAGRKHPDVCRQARRIQRADRASRRGRDAGARHDRARHQRRVGCAERRNPHQRLGRLGRAISSGISAARNRGDRAAHRHPADRRRILCRRGRYARLSRRISTRSTATPAASGWPGGTASARTCSTRNCASSEVANWIEFQVLPTRVQTRARIDGFFGKAGGGHRRHRRARQRGGRRACSGPARPAACPTCTTRKPQRFPHRGDANGRR